MTIEVPQELRFQCEAIETEGRCRLSLPMKASESSTIAVLAEKPSVAQDIARVLGADKRGEGYLQGNGYVVTWAIGHLVSLAQPHEINPEWRQWRFDLLPILPSQWPLVVYETNQRSVRSGAKDPDVRHGCRGSSVQRMPGEKEN